MIAEQLKKAVLQAAIQGKLTERLPEDGDARDLLKDIQKEKASLVKEGKLKKEKPLPAITEDEIPFDIPENWVWVRLGKIGISFSDGVHYAPKYINIGIPCFSAKDIFNNTIDTSKCNYISQEDYEKMRQKINVRKGSLLFTKSGSIGRSCVVSNIGNFGLVESVGVINFSQIDPNFIKALFDLLFNGSNIQNNYTKGIGVKHLTLALVKTIVVPLPPLAEQQRIVEKLDQVLREIENLALKENKLDKLEKAFPKKMKDAILQAAIQGKLTEQLPEDGNARDLLKDIHEEKARLIKEGKFKKEKPLPEISEDEIPFDIPENWVWVRLRELTYNHGQKKPDRVFTYIDIGSVDNNRNILIENLSVLAPNNAPSRARKIVYKDDILYATVRPYLHNTCRIHKLIEPEPIVSTGFEVLRSPIIQVNDYLFPFLLSPLFDGYANDQDNSKGVAYPAINNKKFYKAVVPLPPLAEQQRIVEKLDRVLPLLDRLE